MPEYIYSAVNTRVTIPMAATTRSLNVINAASMVLGEAIRQTKLK